MLFKVHLKTCQQLITILDHCKAEDPKRTEGEASEEAEGRKLEKWLGPHSRDDLALRTSKQWLQSCEQRRKKPEGEKMTEKTAEPHIRTDSPDEDDI